MDRCPEAVLTLVSARNTAFSTRSSRKSYIKQNHINMLFQNKENWQLLVMALEDNISTVNAYIQSLYITFYLFVFCKKSCGVYAYLVSKGEKCHSVAFKETHGKIQ